MYRARLQLREAGTRTRGAPTDTEDSNDITEVPRQFRGCGATLAGNVHKDLGRAPWERVAPLPVHAKRDKEAPMGNWQLDPYHTQVEFSAKHFGMMTVRGHFAEVTTTADIDPEHPETSSVEATIQAASIRTNNEMRDNDLRSPNFLDTDKYPVITFTSSGVQPADRDQYTLTGDLTIKGTTRPVSLEVTKYGELNDPGMMGHRISYGARGQISRTDFGVGTDMVLDGKLVVSNEIQIFIEGELVEQAQAAEATSG
jgi:polyisoprenoid-binding protein YceI